MAWRVQSVAFPRAEWSVTGSRLWLVGHGYTAEKLDATPTQLRWRQRPPAYARYRTSTVVTPCGRRVLLIEQLVL